MCDSVNPAPAPGWRALAARLLPTNWRAFVAWGVAVLFVSLGNCVREHNGDDPRPLPEPPTPIFPDEPFGWRPPSDAERNEHLKSLASPRWQDTDAGRFEPDDGDAPVWRMYQKATGRPFPAHDQGPVGACVAFGAAAAAEFSLCARIQTRKGPPQQFAPTVREALYAGSRLHANPRNPIRNGDGSTGSRASRWLTKGTGGLLPHGTYAGRELTGYDPRRCREWGDRGVPSELVAACKDNPCQTTLVTSAADAKRALQQGYAIFVCSDVGFGGLGAEPIVRDGDGFLRPRGTWMHAMCVAGYRGGPRPGFLIVNSWGERWISGPTGDYADIPPGSFWIEPSVMDRMLRQQDSYAVAGVDGFRRTKIDPMDWVVRRDGVDWLAATR